MAKFHGVVGYGESVQTSPGVWEDVITERPYFGDVIRNTRQLQEAEKVHDNIRVGNSISILADAYAMDHFFAMRYVKWAGTFWIVDDVVEERPRLLLRLGGVYNGPKADASGAPANAAG